MRKVNCQRATRLHQKCIGTEDNQSRSEYGGTSAAGAPRGRTAKGISNGRLKPPLRGLRRSAGPVAGSWQRQRHGSGRAGGLAGCAEVFSATAARMSAFSAFSSILSPSRKIDGTAGVAFEARIEEARGVF